MNTYETLLRKFIEVRPLLQTAIDQTAGEYDLDTIWDGLAKEDLLLWTGPGFAAITEVVNYPKRRMVIVHLASGDIDALKEADGQLVKFAQIVEADAIKIIGRRGWVRALQDLGYREGMTQVIKEVPDGRRK